MYKQQSEFHRDHIDQHKKPFRPAVTKENDLCRHCQTPVITKQHKPGWKPKVGQIQYFEWWLQCPKCKAVYMVEAAKVNLIKEHPAPITLQELHILVKRLEMRVTELERSAK